MPRPRVLVLDEEIPLPPHSGKKLRTYHLLRRLTREFEIHLLVHGNEAEPGRIRELEREGIRTYVAESRLPRKGGPGFVLRVAGNLAFSRLPFSVAGHVHRRYREALRELLAEGGFDLIHCEWTPYAAYLEDPPAPVVVSGHNIETDIWRRLAESEAGGPLGPVYRIQARRMERFERRVFSRPWRFTAVSDGDARRMRAWGARSVTVVPNGVDLEYFHTMPPHPVEPGALVFTGSMDWRANQDAVRWFLDEVLPRIRDHLEATFTVVGRDPPGWMRGRAGRGVVVTGTVDDVRPYVARAQIYVTPLRVGGGSRLKILEAMALGRPVVSTRVGAEGLNLEPGHHLLVADEPDSFAQCVVRLAEDGELRARLVRAAREHVERHCGWDRMAERQAGCWKEALGIA